MNKKELRANSSLLMAVGITALLILGNLILGIVLVRHSKNSMKLLIENRMMDVANTAADMLDGDALSRMEQSDVDSPEYNKVLQSLYVFQNNIDLEYIYTVREVGPREFVFLVDPTISDPAEFGAPVVCTDALETAADGTPSVDKEPYTDKLGRFYSAYSPVFNSAGNVAAVVAVDFSADWYDARIFGEVKVVVFGCIVSLLLGIIFAVLATSYLRKRLQDVNNNLNELYDRVEELTEEVNPGARVKKQYFTKDVRVLSNRISEVKKGLDKFVNDRHKKAGSLISALSCGYWSVYYIDLDNDDSICYKESGDTSDFKEGEHSPYLKSITDYANNYVTNEYREEFLAFVQPDAIRERLKNERIISYLYTIERDGRELYVLIHFSAVRSPEERRGDTIHAVGLSFSDVDRETRLNLEKNASLRQALSIAEQANMDRIQFLSSMGREIINPLNMVMQEGESAAAVPGVPEEALLHLDKCRVSANHLLDIVNDIIDVSNIDTGQMILRSDEFSFSRLVDQINSIISGKCREKGVNYDSRCDSLLDGTYIGDEIKLSQVLLTILSNAVKYTPAGGTVGFISERTAVLNGMDVISIILSDSGAGISPGLRKRIFKPFNQGEYTGDYGYKGTGLSMPIAKRIIDLMEGSISVESEKNKGTSFTINLTLKRV